MEITHRVDKNILYIFIRGKIDSTNASAAQNAISAIRNENKGSYTVIDAEHLVYMSSAGLRVLLKLRKEEPKLAIINASADLYQIFQMTGFTELITIEKAYPRITIDGCEYIARGSNGAVYRYNDDTIVKVYFSKDALPEIKQERENARRAFVHGVNTAIPYGIVRVGEGYGTITELLNATSITKMIRRNPEDLTLAAEYFVDMLKSLHAIEVEDSEFPDMRETALGWADFVAEHIPEDQGKKLRALIEAIPKCNTLLHGDYHTDNVTIQNGEALVIDLETLCMGHPIFELASMFNAFVGFSETNHQNIQDFMGYSFETAGRFWKKVLKMYLGTDDEALCRSVEEKAMVIGYTRLLRRAIRRPQEVYSAAILTRSKEMLKTLLSKVDTLVY